MNKKEVLTKTANVSYAVAQNTAKVSYIVLRNPYTLAFLLAVLTIVGMASFFSVYKYQNPIEIKVQPIFKFRRMEEVISPVAEYTDKSIVPTKTYAQELPEEEPAEIGYKKWEGKASWYGSTLDTCIGCKPYYSEDGEVYFVMRNGEVLDEDDMTLAFHHLPMNSLVRVTNLDNNRSAVARVTDTGGFEDKYGRIADLSKGLAYEIGMATDKSTIRIEEIKPLASN